jgi:hypothetical protein
MHTPFALDARARARSPRSLRFAAISIALRLSLLVTAVSGTSSARGDIAASVGSDGPAIAFNNVDATQGWRFTVDAPIIITALGLLDANLDGFVSAHQIGVWDEEGSLLLAATVQAGTVNPLVSRFRYASVEDGADSTIEPGQTYTIGYFLAAFSDDTYVLHNVHTMHPMINQVGERFFTFGSTFTMPTTAGAGQCFGPNFQFQVVPGPSGAWLLALGLLCRRRRRA